MSPQILHWPRATLLLIALAASCGGKAVIDTPGATGAGGNGANGAGGQATSYGGHATAVTDGCVTFIDEFASHPNTCNIAAGNAACQGEAQKISELDGPCGDANDCVAKQCKCVPPYCSPSTCSCVVSCLEHQHPPTYCFDQFDAYYGCMADYCAG